MTNEDRPRTRRRRSCLVRVIGVIVFLTGALVGLFYWFYTNPISTDKLHSRVVHRLERMTGLDVAYDSASLTLATGTYKLTGLRLMDPEEPREPVLTIGEVYARIAPWQLLSDPESVISKVVLKNPSQLDLVYSERSVRPGARLKLLVESVKKAQPPGTEVGGLLPMDSLRIENAEIAFTESEGILPGINTSGATMIAAGNFLLDNAEEETLAIRFTGHAMRPANDTNSTVTMASGIVTTVQLTTNGAISGTGQIERVAMSQIFRGAPDASLNAGDLEFDFQVASDADRHSLKGTINAEALELSNPGRNLLVSDNQVRLTTDLDVYTSDSLLAVNEVNLESARASFKGSGELLYTGNRDFDISLQTQRIDKEYRDLVERWLPEGWDVTLSSDDLVADLRMQGSNAGLSDLKGNIALRGVSIRNPTLPARLKNLHGDVVLDNTGATFKDITAEYAGARLALDGVFAGDWWEDRAGHLEMNWSAAIILDELTKLHGDQMEVGGADVQATGRITGRGTWVQDVNLRDPEALRIPAVEGEFSFEEIGLSAAILPGPISDLSGKAVVDDNRLEIKDLTGKMRGSELAVDGFVEGTTVFWQDPLVSASLKSRLDLAQIGPYLSDDQRQNLQRYELSGLADTEMLLNGPLKDLASQFTGLVNLDGVAVTPRFDFMNGRFEDVSGVILWDGRKLDLENVTGKLNGQVVDLGGSLAGSGVRLRVNTDTTLDAIEDTFPEIDKYLDMTGSAACDLVFSVGEVSADVNTVQPLMTVVESARALVDDAVKSNTFSLDGELRLNDATLRHIAMPLERDAGARKLPEGKLTNLSGTIRIKDDLLSVPESDTLDAAFADTPNCRISGTLRMRPGNYPAMDIKISSAGTMKLDTWATGWGKGLPRLEKPPMTGKKVDVSAEIVAPSIVYQGQEAGRSRGRVIFSMTQNDTPRVTTFEEIVIQGSRQGEGRIIGSGRIESYIWNPRQFPRWQTSLDVQAMPVNSLLTAVFKKQSDIYGMVTGKVDLQGLSDDPLSIRGMGSNYYMTNLEMSRTPVIRELGQTTGRNFGGTLFQTARAANFSIGNGAVSTRDLALETNGLQLEVRGDYWFAGNPALGIAPGTIDGALRLRLFKSVFGSIPLIGQVADLADEVTNAFLLAFRVTGSAQQPRVTPVPLPMFQGGS